VKEGANHSMPTIDIATSDRLRIEGLVEFMRRQIYDLPVEARMVLVIELTRLFRPEINELKRKAKATL
jgi:hypothetical protein